ncbi:hypothetical protein AVEN_40245-1 [Araneus ventricosus]|uniref:PiggyBac transposable element-derived protein domain-containing protein n=1 Tax=Araneus ventricosus TaxID=182803 RepID=A0A4Y2JBY8_ARAVE|nr:hypothetical protein AVEN_40245-1 [Araneus ventricosus]
MMRMHAKFFSQLWYYSQREKILSQVILDGDKQMKTGDSGFCLLRRNICCKMRDRGKIGRAKSNLHDPNVTSSVLRTNKKEEKRVQCPLVINYYNQYMGGVDRFDHLMAAYSLS